MSYFRETEPRIPSRNPLVDVQTYIRDEDDYDEYGDHLQVFRKRLSMIPPLKALSQEDQEDIFKKAMEMERDYNKRFVEYIASSLLKPLPTDDKDNP